MKAKLTRKQLKNRLFLSEARQVHQLHFASSQLHKCSTKKLFGSEVILQLNFNDKDLTEVIPPVSIDNGLSLETIEAIKQDLKRTFNYRIELIPKDWK